MDTNFIVEYVIDFIISKVDIANALGLIGGIFYVMSVTLRTMIPLRIAAIASNILFMGYGLLAKALPTFFMYAVLLADQLLPALPDSAIGEAREGCFAGRLEHGLAQAVHDPAQFQGRRRAVPEGRYRRRDVLHRHRKIPGQGNRRRTAARPGDGRARLSGARQQANRDRRMHRGWPGTCSSSTTRCANCIFRIRISDSIS